MSCRHSAHYILIPALLTFSSCSSEILEEFDQSNESKPQIEVNANTQEDMFARPNGETTLAATVIDINSNKYYNDPACAVDVALLMAIADPNNASGLNNVEITTAQMDEVKKFVEEKIVTSDMNEVAKTKAILKWVNSNISYDWVDNSAYAVFKNRKGVCQGYSNLMNVMLHTQGIKCVNANGFMANVGGHAWVYVYADSVWYVSDPTNTPNKIWTMSDVASYKSTLQPWTIDMPLFEDSLYVYDWRDKLFNIREVKSPGGQAMSVPFGAMGYRLTGFDPIDGIGEDVREFYISTNIRSIGDYAYGLNDHGKNLENIFVWNDKNHLVNDYDGCIYTVSYSSSTKSTTYNELKYIPGQKKAIKVAPMKVATKNIIYGQNNIEEVRFDEVTLTYENSCIESCPNLHFIYIPTGSKVNAEAFYDCAADLQVIEYDPTETGIEKVFFDSNS